MGDFALEKIRCAFFCGFRVAFNLAVLDDASEKLGNLFRVFDGTIEGNRAPHRGGINAFCAVTLGLDGSLFESVIAADNFHNVVQIQLVVFIGNLMLKGFADEFFVHRQNHDFVIREQATADGFREIKAMKFFTVKCGIVHRIKLNVRVFCFSFGSIVVNSRRGRHIKAFLRLDEILFVNGDEIGKVFAVLFHAGGAVRLVANHEVKFRHAKFLRFGNDGYGLIR